METIRPLYLTTPIYYANDVPAHRACLYDHRRRRRRPLLALAGTDVFLLTGTDEHGVNIERIAEKRGSSPQQHVDEFAAAFIALWQRLDIQYDRFIRTTEPEHKAVALDAVASAAGQRRPVSRRLRRAPTARAVRPTTTSTSSSTTPARCTTCRATTCARRTGSSGCRAIRNRSNDWCAKPTSCSRWRGATRSSGVLSQGLKDFSVSRRQVRWGIPVPETPDEVLYVWVDALANYLRWLPDDQHVRPADTHLVGKEIIRFHCLYWPALLSSAGLPLPRRVFAHGWLTKDGQKISKTTGNTIDPAALADEFGSDAVRYYFLRAIPFGQDGDFTHGDFVARYTADLANDFGNLVQRATTLASRTLMAASRQSRRRGRAAAALVSRDAARSRPGRDRAAGAARGARRDQWLCHRRQSLRRFTAPWNLAKQGDDRSVGAGARPPRRSGAPGRVALRAVSAARGRRSAPAPGRRLAQRRRRLFFA